MKNSNFRSIFFYICPGQDLSLFEMASLRHRGKVPGYRQEEIYEELKLKNERHNSFFKSVFLFMSIVLGAARLILLFYAFVSPFSLGHQAEAHSVVGESAVWVMELVGAVSLLLCAAYFVRNNIWLIVVTAAINVVEGVWLCLTLMESGVDEWFWDRGWWHIAYYPGFSLFYCGVSFYANLLINDLAIAQAIESLGSQTPTYNV